MIGTCKICKETADLSLNKKEDAVICGSCGKEFILENKMMMKALQQNKNTEKTSGAEVLIDCPNCGRVEGNLDKKNQVVCGECSTPIKVNDFMRRIIMGQQGINAPIV